MAAPRIWRECHCCDLGPTGLWWRSATSGIRADAPLAADPLQTTAHLAAMRIFVPSAATHKYTAWLAGRRTGTTGLPCSQWHEELLITARGAADLHACRLRVASGGAAQMRSSAARQGIWKRRRSSEPVHLGTSSSPGGGIRVPADEVGSGIDARRAHTGISGRRCQSANGAGRRKRVLGGRDWVAPFCSARIGLL